MFLGDRFFRCGDRFDLYFFGDRFRDRVGGEWFLFFFRFGERVRRLGDFLFFRLGEFFLNLLFFIFCLLDDCLEFLLRLCFFCLIGDFFLFFL